MREREWLGGNGSGEEETRKREEEGMVNGCLSLSLSRVTCAGFPVQC